MAAERVLWVSRARPAGVSRAHPRAGSISALVSPHSSGDRASASGAGCASSNLAGGAHHEAIYVPSGTGSPVFFSWSGTRPVARPSAITVLVEEMADGDGAPTSTSSQSPRVTSKIGHWVHCVTFGSYSAPIDAQ